MLSHVTGEAVGATTGRTRLLRASVLGGLSLLLASGAHVVGGGHPPGVGVLLVAATLLGMAAAVVTARRCRFGVLALLLAGQQALLHLLFTVASSAAPVHLAQTHHHAAPPSGAGLVAPAMDMPGPGWVMWAAHAAATLATAWLLARGEAWLWRAAERVVVAAGLGRTVHVRRAALALPGTAYLLPRLDAPAWNLAGPRGPPAVVAG
jgi:hypothetical protein